MNEHVNGCLLLSYFTVSVGFRLTCESNLKEQCDIFKFKMSLFLAVDNSNTSITLLSLHSIHAFKACLNCLNLKMQLKRVMVVDYLNCTKLLYLLYKTNG